MNIETIGIDPNYLAVLDLLAFGICGKNLSRVSVGFNPHGFSLMIAAEVPKNIQSAN